jgi:hypothetical protein
MIEHPSVDALIDAFDRPAARNGKASDADIAAILATVEDSEDICAQPFERIEWEIAGLLTLDEQPGFLYGLPGAGKSIVAGRMCVGSVTGGYFLGRKMRQRPSALYVNFDAGEKAFRNRIRRIGGAPGFKFINLRSAQWTPALFHALMEANRGGFVVLDALASIYRPNKNEDPAWDMRQFCDGVRNMYEDYACGGQVLDHATKGGLIYGSIQKPAAFRTIWQINPLAKNPATPSKHTFIVHCEKLNDEAHFRDLQVCADFSDPQVDPLVKLTVDGTIANSKTTIAAEPPMADKVEAWAIAHAAPFSKKLARAAIKGRDADIIAAVDELYVAGRLVTPAKKSYGYVHASVASSEGVPGTPCP